MKVKLFLLLLITIISSCTVQRVSKLTSDNIKPGLSKEEVIALCGKPYKEAFNYTEDKILVEQLYYKEELFVNKWVEVTTILHFEDSKLVSIEPFRERSANDKGWK